MEESGTIAASKGRGAGATDQPHKVKWEPYGLIPASDDYERFPTSTTPNGVKEVPDSESEKCGTEVQSSGSEDAGAGTRWPTRS